MKKLLWLTGLAVTFSLSMSMESFAKETEPTIHEGVYLDQIDVSGMTQEQAQETLDNYVNQLKAETLTLKVEEHEVQLLFGDLGLTCTNTEVVEEAVGLGRTGNIIKRYKEQKDIEHENRVFDLAWSVDSELVAQEVETECVKFNVEAVDNGLKRVNGEFQFVPGTTGLLLNVEESIAAIIDYVENGWDKENGSVSLVAEIDNPQGSEEELAKIQDVLGTFSTSFSSSGANRSANVANGAKLINGTVLYPGETFSAYDTVSPFTEENGYEMAGSYLNGKVVDSMGGGICQVSSTLYNAVLRAELEVVERSGHSMLVGYVDPSADAAISGTYKDFKFTNNSDTPVYIEGGTSGNKVITFSIYGQETRDSNRTIKYISQILSTTEPGVQIIADATQGIGYRTVESAHRGMVAELYKHVYINGVEESVKKVSKSTYGMSPRTIVIGVAGDPDLSARLQAAVATQDEAAVNEALAYCLSNM